MPSSPSGSQRECRLPLVINAPYPIRIEGAQSHVSGISGLIHATRRAVAVIGVDSGPLALGRRAGKTGRGHLWAYRSGPARTLRRHVHGVAKRGRHHHVSPNQRPGPQHARHRPRIRCSRRWKRFSQRRTSVDTRMSVFPKPYADLVQRLRVPAGFVLVVAFAWLSQPEFSIARIRTAGIFDRTMAARVGERPPGEERPSR